MAQAQLTAAVIFAVLGVLLILIATTITGIISARATGETKTRLLAVTALSVLTSVFAVVTGIIGILYGRARKAGTPNAKGLGITFIVLAIITLLMYITVVALDITVRGRTEINPTEKNAITASIILIAVGFVSLVVSTILFFSITKGKSGQEAISALKFQRRPRSVAVGSSGAP